MILGIRVVEIPLFHGIQLFVLRDWHDPIDELANDCFRVFDESLEKQKGDPDATRLQSTPQQDDESARLHTASETALRSLPERIRPWAKLYTLALSSSSARRVLCHLPNWVRIKSESRSGNLQDLSWDHSDTWTAFDLERDEIALHVKFFDDQSPPSLGRVPKEIYFRTAELFARPHRLELPLAIFTKFYTEAA